MWTRCALCCLVVALSACTKDNPHACGETDPCTDPALPFCDLDGLVAGTPGACIAGDCTPGAFAACNGDQAIQCNAAGTNYDNVVCELGCDPASNGCRLCNPNETACTNGITATCDASGAIVDMTPCPLGCFESEPRCRDVDPSNGLAQYLDMAAAGPDLVLTGMATISTITGNVTNGDGNPVAVASFLAPAPAGGVPIRVFVLGSATIENLAFDGPPSEQEIPAVALVADRDVVIHGLIDLTPSRPRDAPGSRLSTACVGGPTNEVIEADRDYVRGGGGGGGATPGGRGGDIANLAAPASGSPGAAVSVPTIEPLVGGCAGGGGASGGAGIQIVSRTAIRVEVGGGVNAGGAGGEVDQGTVTGGGSGGAILFEAPLIVLASGTGAAANGGAGATGAGGTGSAGALSTTAATAPGCGAKPAYLCGIGGNGGARATAPTAGGDLSYATGSGVQQWSGGGGGSVGRIRFNTRDGTYVKASDVIESPAPSTGAVRTR